MAEKPPPIPAERAETVREELERVLRESASTARELSEKVGIREKDVPFHLEHLEQSLRAAGKRLVVTPSSCRACGFVFKHREKLKRPSRCPECGSNRIEPPRFQVE